MGKKGALITGSPRGFGHANARPGRVRVLLSKETS
jgi:hypothetical protein